MTFKKTFHSNLDSKAIQHILKTDYQNKNYFKLILIESTENNVGLGGLASIGLSALGTAMGTAISVIYLRSVTIPSTTISYEGELEKYPRSIKSPDNISMTFIDDSYGTVRRYLSGWFKQTVLTSYSPSSKGAGDSFKKTVFPQDNVSFVFADNQMAAKKIGILMMGSTTGELNPLKYPRTMIYGLRPLSIGSLQLSNEETGAVTYEVEFSVDEVATPLV